MRLYLKALSPRRRENRVPPEALVLWAPAHQEGTSAHRQALFQLARRAALPAPSPLLTALLSLQVSVTPQLKMVTKKNSTETQRKGPGRGCAFKELLPADSAAQSSITLNGFQLQGWPPEVNERVQLKITLNYSPHSLPQSWGGEEEGGTCSHLNNLRDLG